MHMRKLFVLALTTATLLPAGLQAQATYVYTDLGNLPAQKQTIPGIIGNVTETLTESEAYAISNTGHVVGDMFITASNVTTTNPHGITQTDEREMSYFAGTTGSFGVDLGGNNSFGRGINASGQVAGSSETLQHPDLYEAVSYSNGAFEYAALATTGNESESYAINKLGHITGWQDEDIQITNNSFSIVPRAFVWKGGVAATLADLNTSATTANSTTYSYGQSINSSDAVAGYSTVSVNGTFTVHGCIMQVGHSTIDVGTIPSANNEPNPSAISEAFGINDDGDVCGFSTDLTGKFDHAFLYTGGVSGTMEDIGTLPGGKNSIAQGINNSGSIVGYGDSGEVGNELAWVYSGGVMQDINTLTTGQGNWVMEAALGINDSGQIVGVAVYTNSGNVNDPLNGAIHGFLVTPVALATPPTVSTAPANFTAFVGQNYVISSNITGSSNLTFQWYDNGAAISGATASDLTLNDVQFSSAGNYSVVATNLVGTVSTNVTVTVIQPATITTQPGGVLQAFGGLVGRPASLTVGAVGSGTLTYEWQSSSDNITWTDVPNTSPFSGVNSPTLSISATTIGMNGLLFRCIVNNVAAIPAISNTALLEVGVPPTISVPVGNLTINQGTDANLTATFAGTAPIAYQWSHNGTPISGANTSTLALTNAQTATGGSYSVVASNALGSVTSTSVVTVLLLPDITKQPANAGFIAGRNATFSITATGTPTLTYAWQDSLDGGNTWSNIAANATFAGTTTPTLSVNNVTLTMNAEEFRCVVNNPSNVAVPSNAATLTVGLAPTIATAPLTQAVNQGTTPTLTVVASGSSTPPLTYQWNFAGKPIVGATGSSYTISGNGSGIQAANAGNYSVVVSNAIGNVTSSANVSVIILPIITSQPVPSTVIANRATSFKVTATGSPTLTYQWQSSPDGISWVNVINNSTINGNNTATLAISNATLAMNGTQFQVVVNNPSNVPATSIPALLSTGLVPTITTGIGNNTTNQNASVTLSVTPAGTAPFTYLWKHGATVLSSTTNSYTIASPQAADAGAYSVVVGNAYGNVTSNGNLAVTLLPTITSQPVNSTVIANRATSFKVVATGTPTLTYQWQESTNGGTSFSNLTNVGPFSGVTTSTLAVSNATLAMNGTEFQVVVNNPSNVANISIPALLSTGLVPTITTGIGNTTTNQNASVTLSVTAAGTAPFTYVWKHGTTVLSSTTNSYTIASPQAADAGAYSVVVSNPYGNVTSTGNLVVILVPAITSQPANSTVIATHATSFKVVATGTPTLTYQWQLSSNISGPFTPVINNGTISGNNTPTLAISNATLAMNGTYFQVVINNPSNVPATSNPALLSTGLVPTITTAPGNQTVNQNGTAVFSVTAAGTGPLSYQWSLGNTTINGGTNPTLTISNAQAADAGKYSVAVTNAYGAATAAANLTVINLPVITAQPGNQTIIAGRAATFKVVATGTPTLTYQWQAFVTGNWSNLTDNGTVTGTATANLTIPSTTLSMNGTQYRAVVNNASNVANISTSALLNVGIPPNITSLTPANTTVNQNTPVTLTVALAPNSSTTPLTYQWSINGTVLGSQTNSTLSIPSAQGTDAGKYSVLVSNAWGNATAATNLTVIVLPVVNAGGQPTNFNAAVGKSATFSVSAGGTGPLTYQWQVSIDGGGNFTNIASNNPTFTGATTSKLTIGTTTFAMNANGGWKFRVIITNSSGVPATSSVSTLTVGNAPSINSPPSNQSVLSGGNVTFTVVATGDPTLTYQWSLGATALVDDNVTVTGSSTPTLTLNGVTSINAGNYFVAVTNAFGTASAQVSLTVTNPVPALVNGVSSGVSSADIAGSSGKSPSLVGPSLAEPVGYTVISGELAGAIVVPGSILTPSEVSAELLSAMNLNATSDVSLLPTAMTSESGGVDYAMLQYQQAKTVAGSTLTVQYGYATSGNAPAAWINVPASNITQLPNADASTSVYQAHVPIPQGEGVYFRISTSE